MFIKSYFANNRKFLKEIVQNLDIVQICVEGEQNFSKEKSTPGPSATGDPGNRRLQQTQAQVNEVVDIMRVNVDKVLERDQKLTDLDDRADALQAGASQFETSAAKLKRKYWWKNCKINTITGKAQYILESCSGSGTRRLPAKTCSTLRVEVPGAGIDEVWWFCRFAGLLYSDFHPFFLIMSTSIDVTSSLQ
ncbi:hypothetical protein XELAEV_18037616mg [Xenopus laevis]|uniref:V-SNARE coiled-coil homology domain-containing protein n=1 Tax=Xenopus laevis TaxID=8355 RepID=A0A974CCN6_XENLA|nr:hypothetical protein XELAEV_18037616mg [Xenopus laevis]